MNYKGYKIERAFNPIYGKFYYISKDGEQIYPNDQEIPYTIAQCKVLINKIAMP